MRLWRKSDIAPEGKYLVQRRDGTVPAWANFVLGERDPNSPAGLRGYADEAEKNGLDPLYVADIRAMADEWALVSAANPGDPDAGPHRKDDPAIIAKMRAARGS